MPEAKKVTELSKEEFKDIICSLPTVEGGLSDFMFEDYMFYIDNLNARVKKLGIHVGFYKEEK